MSLVYKLEEVNPLSSFIFPAFLCLIIQLILNNLFAEVESSLSSKVSQILLCEVKQYAYFTQLDWEMLFLECKY